MECIHIRRTIEETININNRTVSLSPEQQWYRCFKKFENHIYEFRKYHKKIGYWQWCIPYTCKISSGMCKKTCSCGDLCNTMNKTWWNVRFPRCHPVAQLNQAATVSCSCGCPCSSRWFPHVSSRSLAVDGVVAQKHLPTSAYHLLVRKATFSWS
jgi:hypothetical protein